MILVLGGAGQVGSALAAASPEVLAVDRRGIDVTDPRALRSALARLRPRLVVNAAAYTAVDRAEVERDAAFRINADGAGHVAAAAAAFDVPLVHLSTDYVFDGTAAPYRPGDPTAPLNVYGASKLAGEEAVRAAAPRSVILRTSWVFARRTGFVATILRRARAGQPLRVVDDQLGNPTPADEVARAVLGVAERLGDEPWGTFHAAGQPATSWHGLARAALDAARLRAALGAVPTAAWPTRARRPRDSRLDTSAFEAQFGVALAWAPALAAVAAEQEAR